MSATATVESTTAVPTRKRVGDGLTFFSSHSACYALGLHSKTAAGRESCRTGQGGRPAQKLPLCAHSPDSKTMHLVSAVSADGNANTLCGKDVPEKWEQTRTEPTCKNCIKRQS